MVRRAWRGPWSRKISVRKSHYESQCGAQPTEVAFIEAANGLSNPRSSNRHRLVGHDLGACPKSIAFARIDRDAKIRRLDQFRGQLADHERGARLWKRVRLHDDRRSRFSIVAGRGHDDDITASHRPLAGWARRTRKLPRSS